MQAQSTCFHPKSYYSLRCKACDTAYRRSRDPYEMFWRQVVFTDSCWLWTGSTTHGYGVFRKIGIRIAAHRFAYLHLVGPIPDGFVIDHLCRNPPCVNPAHMEPVTIHENAQVRAPTSMVNKTHCKHGHPFDAVNTWWRRKRGRTPSRECLTCHRARKRAAYHARR
jgi:hypothetical protein